MGKISRTERLREFSKQQQADGHHIEALWLDFYSSSPHELDPDDYNFARAMYFAGAQDAFYKIRDLSELVEVSEPGPAAEKKMSTVLKQISDEFAKHREEVLFDTQPHKGHA